MIYFLIINIKIMKPKSKQPRKQRKYRYDAPLHRRHKMVAGHLSKELKGKYNRRSLPIRKGDRVKVVRGQYEGIEGEVLRVDLRKYRIYMEGVSVKKTDGTDVERPIDPSNVMITDLFLEDKERREVLEKKLEE